MHSDSTIIDLLARQKFLPLFNCGDAATGMQVLEALHAGGVRIVEFTNRSAGALDVFGALAEQAAGRLPDMMLGAGTIIDRPQAEAFHAAGARFIVAPNLDADVGRDQACLELIEHRVVDLAAGDQVREVVGEPRVAAVQLGAHAREPALLRRLGHDWCGRGNGGPY